MLELCLEHSKRPGLNFPSFARSISLFFSIGLIGGAYTRIRKLVTDNASAGSTVSGRNSQPQHNLANDQNTREGAVLERPGRRKVHDTSPKLLVYEYRIPKESWFHACMVGTGPTSMKLRFDLGWMRLLVVTWRRARSLRRPHATDPPVGVRGLRSAQPVPRVSAMSECPHCHHLVGGRTERW